MAENVTLTGLTVEYAAFYNRTLLERMKADLFYFQFAQKTSLSKRKGDKVSFRRFDEIEERITPLEDGKTPDGQVNDISEVIATIKQYGSFIPYTDKVDKMAIDPYLTATIEALGESAAKTIDSIIRNAVLLTTNVHCCGGKIAISNMTASDKITDLDIRKAVRTMKNANVKPYKDGYYICIVHPNVEFDIQSLATWQDVSKYNGGEAIKTGEIGKIHGVRFYRSTQISAQTVGSIPIYMNTLLGQGGYGVTELAKKGSGKAEIIIKEVGSSGTSDPLNQRGCVGWKSEFAVTIINEAAVMTLACAVS